MCYLFVGPEKKERFSDHLMCSPVGLTLQALEIINSIALPLFYIAPNHNTGCLKVLKRLVITNTVEIVWLELKLNTKTMGTIQRSTWLMSKTEFITFCKMAPYHCHAGYITDFELIQTQLCF